MSEGGAAQEGLPIEQREREPIRWGRIAGLAPVFLVLAVVAPAAIRIVGLEAFAMEGPSMAPSVLDGDRFVVDKTAYGLWLPGAGQLRSWGTPERGDVVVLRSPAEEGVDIVKRVVGLPGDIVEIREGVPYIDGEPIEREGLDRCPERDELRSPLPAACARETLGEHEYVTMSAPPARSEPPTVVPPDHVYLLGDHRDRSNDSRNLGPISITALKGRVTRIYWSSSEDGNVRWDRIGEAAQ